MATDFQMPKLGLTMEEGTILEWLVADGAEIEVGTPVLRIETDKVETDVEAVAAGRLCHWASPGDTFACGAVIGVVLAPGEQPPVRATAPGSPAAGSPSASGAEPGTAASLSVAVPGNAVPDRAEPATSGGGAPHVAERGEGGRLLASPNARRVAVALGVSLDGVQGSGPGGRIVSEDVEAAASLRPPAAASGAPMPHRTATSPGAVAVAGGAAPGVGAPATIAARQLADLLGVDLGTVAPDAADGRITRDAVAVHVRNLLARLAVPGPVAGPLDPGAGDPGGSRGGAVTGALVEPTQPPTRTIRLSGMRGTIAKRMHASLQSMAQLTLTMDAPMELVVADRNRRKADGGPTPSYTDYIIGAVARALRSHPIVNSQVTTAGIAVLPDVHVGLAVALPDGLVVPVVRHTDRLGLGELAVETARLAVGARAGTLGVGDYDAATFSVSALGMFGVDAFTPVVNPPNAAILGIGRLRRDFAWRDDVPVPEQRLTLSLTWDHRVFDGAPAAEFCRSIVEFLQDPSSW